MNKKLEQLRKEAERLKDKGDLVAYRAARKRYLLAQAYERQKAGYAGELPY